MEDWPTHVVTRVSLIRSPIQACALSMMMYAAPRLETLELLDIGAHLWVGSALVDLLRIRSKTLRFLALRLNHQPDDPGVLDTILEVSAARLAVFSTYWTGTYSKNIMARLGLPTPRSPSRTPGPHFPTILRPTATFSLRNTPTRFVDRPTDRFLWQRVARRALGEGS
jgi:hypothetical protein